MNFHQHQSLRSFSTTTLYGIKFTHDPPDIMAGIHSPTASDHPGLHIHHKKQIYHTWSINTSEKLVKTLYKNNSSMYSVIVKELMHIQNKPTFQTLIVHRQSFGMATTKNERTI